MGTEYASTTPKSPSSVATPDEEFSEPDRRKSMDFSPLSVNSILYYYYYYFKKFQELKWIYTSFFYGVREYYN